MKVYRANDDGEPNNSAGQPILGQIQSFELTNVLIGVVRYYGGTKLGVGGLINAYRTAAKEAIENGKIVVKEVFFWADLNFSYEDMPSIMNFIKQNNITIENQLFELNCNLKVRLDLNASEHLIVELKKYASIKITELGIY
jgi:putative IMPACT (imprinted ancient) family translation regulator